jgi:cytochrome oxidase Cu insertion factor (SCO1/SenC/PrrC family)
MKRRLLVTAALLMVGWVAFVSFIYAKMTAPPEEFTATMAKLPMPAMMLFPFETLWSSARAGTLQPGDIAPDFELQTADRARTIRLSDYRGRPVVIVFGSYT